VASYFLLPAGGVAQAVVFMACETAAAAVLLATILRVNAGDRLVWLILTLGQVLSLVGNAVWYISPVLRKIEMPFPSVADAMFLGSYGISIVGLIWVVQRRSRGQGWAPLLDVAIITAGLAAISYVTVIDPQMQATGLSLTTKLVAAAYPLIDLAILAVVARLAIAGGMGTPSVLLLICWGASQLVGDTMFASASVGGSFSFGHPSFAGWLLAYTFLGTAALHPSRSDLMVRVPRRVSTGMGKGKLALLGVASLLAPAELIFQLLFEADDALEITVLSALTILIFVLVFIRMAGLMRVLATSEAVTRHTALHDGMTGLANRSLVVDRATQALRAALRSNDAVSLLMVDLDGFKQVNDGLGHEAGDDLLRHVAQRLEACVRPGDTAARWGGDEFCVLLPHTDEGAAAVVAQRIVQALAVPVAYKGSELSVGASVGIAGSADGRSAEELFRNADVAMYAAKAKGKGVYEFFQPSMHADILQSMALRNDLEHAISNDEFVVDYQPLVDLGSGKFVGVEALVRWNHPRRGLVPPAEFIGLAEQTGLIVELGQLVLRRACVAVSAWRRDHPNASDLNLSVNFSARQLVDPALKTQVMDVLKASGLDPTALTVEVTESLLVDESSGSVQMLASLREAGIKVAIDDFGTGYSALGSLRTLPADVVKIDRSFVRHLKSHADRAFARSIVSVIQTLGMETVAEGIETEEQAAHMQALGCDRGQGFFFARPMVAEDISELLSGERRFDRGTSTVPIKPRIVAPDKLPQPTWGHARTRDRARLRLQEAH
jgi:diguanylate cyclase (GGDEF)-like protein